IGEDTLLLCDNCGYAANRQIARIRKPEAQLEQLLPMEKVATPQVKTIEALAEFLDIPQAKTAKAVFMVAEVPEGKSASEKFIFAVVRGDMEVNETKLANAVKARALRPATEDEIRAVGAVPGYASPLALKDTLVVVDDLVPSSPNLVAGANLEGYHMRNVNYGRDYQAYIVTDITLAREGDACPECGAGLRTVRGVEVGNIFKLGTRYSDALGAYFLDADGEQKPVIMGSYGIGSGRLMACIAEEHHDEHGLIWPVTVAPFQVHLVALAGRGSDETQTAAEQIYEQLQQAGIEVLYDDREESPGVKFNDADLIGIPLRLTVSERARKQGGVELKRRDQEVKEIVTIDELISFVLGKIRQLEAEVAAKVVEVEFVD
ncbi:MAG: proline--tRNA ligase, partial [Anaerolineales bacterium]